MYHQQQNKWYPLKGFYLPISKLCSIILAVANLLAHNNVTISYYGQVNSVRLKSSSASKWASKDPWHTIYFAVDHHIFHYLNSTLRSYLHLSAYNPALLNDFRQYIPVLHEKIKNFLNW